MLQAASIHGHGHVQTIRPQACLTHVVGANRVCPAMPSAHPASYGQPSPARTSTISKPFVFFLPVLECRPQRRRPRWVQDGAAAAGAGDRADARGSRRRHQSGEARAKASCRPGLWLFRGPFFGGGGGGGCLMMQGKMFVCCHCFCISVHRGGGAAAKLCMVDSRVCAVWICPHARLPARLICPPARPPDLPARPPDLPARLPACLPCPPPPCSPRARSTAGRHCAWWPGRTCWPSPRP